MKNISQDRDNEAIGRTDRSQQLRGKMGNRYDYRSYGNVSLLSSIYKIKIVPVAADRMGFALNKAMLCIEQESVTEEGVYRSR